MILRKEFSYILPSKVAKKKWFTYQLQSLQRDLEDFLLKQLSTTFIQPMLQDLSTQGQRTEILFVCYLFFIFAKSQKKSINV